MKMEVQHTFTANQKLEWFGDGPWVAEPDRVDFEYEGYKCRIIRAAIGDGPNHVFGGHLCGYVMIPKGHPWHGKFYDDIECECHGGLTYSGYRFIDADEFWIGFDCGHMSDIVPSTEKILGKRVWSMEFVNPTYRDLHYCIGECKDLALQARDIDEKTVQVVVIGIGLK